MKKALLSFVISTTMILPLSAVEVYNKDDSKVDIYGSIRGLVGYGTTRDFYKEYLITNFNAGHTLFQLQSNSRLGVNVNIGALFSKIEMGIGPGNSNSIDARFRQAYAGYDFGGYYGTLLIGKTVSIAGTDFSSDIFFGDSGLVGFGNGSQGERRFQIQYISPFGVSFAVMEKNIVLSPGTADSTIDYSHTPPYIPVFALSYDYMGLDDNLIAKIGASYTLMNVKTKGDDGNGNGGGGASYGNGAGFKVPIHAYAINLAATYKLLDKKLYFTGIASYSMNAHLYSDTLTPSFGTGSNADSINVNSYKNHSNDTIAISHNKPNNNHIVSAAFEAGYNVLDNLKAIIGGGYQNSTKKYWNNNVRNISKVHSYGLFVQAVYAVNKFLVLMPEVAYYGILEKDRAKVLSSGGSVTKDPYRAQLLTAIQTRFNF